MIETLSDGTQIIHRTNPDKGKVAGGVQMQKCAVCKGEYSSPAEARRCAEADHKRKGAK